MVDSVAATPVKKGRKPKDGTKKKAAKSSRPPTMQLIVKAIGAEKDPKGTSVMAIKKYIMAHYKVKSSVMLNHMLRRAFDAGLAAGKLSRPKGQGDSHLLAGRYRLASKEKAATASKPKKAKSPVKKPAAKKPKTKTPKKKTATKKAKSPAKAKKSPKKPAVKKTAAKKKSPKKAAKKA